MCAKKGEILFVEICIVCLFLCLFGCHLYDSYGILIDTD